MFVDNCLITCLIIFSTNFCSTDLLTNNTNNTLKSDSNSLSPESLQTSTESSDNLVTNTFKPKGESIE